MSYGNPSVASAVAALAREGCDEVLLFPQYPHYAMASWETVVARVYEEAAQRAPGMRVTCVQPFYGDPDYIEMLHAVAAPFLADAVRPPPLQLPRHSGAPPAQGRLVPRALHDRRRLLHDLLAGARDLLPGPVHPAPPRNSRDVAGLDPKKYSMSFQSRLAGEPWLQPFTDFEFVRLAKAGAKRLLVMCPSFLADCLETLEEISMAGKGYFLRCWRRTF